MAMVGAGFEIDHRPSPNRLSAHCCVQAATTLNKSSCPVQQQNDTACCPFKALHSAPDFSGRVLYRQGTEV